MAVKVYSGIAPPKALLDAMAASGQQQASPEKLSSRPIVPPGDPGERPPMPPRPSAPPVPSNSDDPYDDAPPSYEDAMAETLSPVDGPRREYNPPVASAARRSPESGADSKPPVDSDNNHERRPPFYGNNSTISSTETFDMLPSTPPEIHSDTPPQSPAERPQSTIKVPGNRNPPPDDSLPQYQPVAESQGQASSQQVDGTRPLRPMNLGVPNRKPVPRSPSAKQA